ncbi:hypothetical protein CAAN1_10S05116 [[Candida] anglica]
MTLTLNGDMSSIVTPLLQLGPFNESPDEYTKEFALESLVAAKVLVIGAGGLGCEILKNLALTGFKDIHVIDMDTIDISNLNRQFLFRKRDVGRSKAEVAAQVISNKIGNDQVKITPYFGKIQDKPIEYYQQFTVVICGLDSVEARRWINATLVSMVDDELNNLIPLIDGGTEGFRGQARVILPTLTSCYECSLDMLSTRATYPVCTIANTPRLPEHCIEWASVLEWPQQFPTEKFDSDNPMHLDWMYHKSLERAREFNIDGVTRSLTLGVVKNIIPAIAATNAIVAAACCNEVFKIVTNSNPILTNYMMYSGDDSIFTYTFNHTRKPDCPVCGNSAKRVVAQNWWTLQEFIDSISNSHEVQMKKPSLTTSRRNLYLRAPPSLEELSRPNLTVKLNQLVLPGEEILVTDPALPLSLKLAVSFEGHDERPNTLKELLS